MIPGSPRTQGIDSGIIDGVPSIKGNGDADTPISLDDERVSRAQRLTGLKEKSMLVRMRRRLVAFGTAYRRRPGR
jgi:hypothetical protein